MMIRSVAVILSVLCFNWFAWGAGGGWVKFSEGPPMSYSLHTDMVYKDGVVKIWQRFEHAKPKLYKGRQYITDQNRIAYDCNGEWMAIDSVKKTAGHNGEGEVIQLADLHSLVKVHIDPDDRVYNTVVKQFCEANQKQ